MILGAAYVSFLAIWVGRADHVPGEEIGARAQELRTFIEGHFGTELHRFAVAIVAFSLAVGALLGLVASVMMTCRDRVVRTLGGGEDRPPRSPTRRALESLGLVAAMHAAAVAWGMARTPGLYERAFYAQGGTHRLVQILISDALGRAGMAAAALLFLVAYLAGPRATWGAWPVRLRRGRALLVAPRAVKLLRRTYEERFGTAMALACLAFAVSIAFGARRLLAGSSAGTPPSAQGEGQPMNVLILAADSLRADRFDPRTMPQLTAWASRATIFDKAYVSLPRTFPSWVTWLTGRAPHHHGIVTMFPRWEDRAKDFDALPENLNGAGYRTIVVSDFVGDIFTRIDLGFSHVDAPNFDFVELLRGRLLGRETPLLPFLDNGIGRRIFPVLREMESASDPELLADHALAAIDRSAGEPFFMTVFAGSAHFPYAARAPYHQRFTSPSYRGPFKYERAMDLENEAPPTEEDVAQIRALYDGAVQSIDDAYARILKGLEKRHLADRTIVVVLADHGEDLYEPGRGPGHGDHLFGDEATHVPFVIFDPRHPDARHEPSIVRDIDFAPTIYELLGRPLPKDLDGRSLMPALSSPPSPLPPALAFSETEIWFTEEISTLSPQGLRLPYPGIDLITEVDDAHHREIVLQKRMVPIVVAAKHRMVRDQRFKLVYVPTRMGAKYMLYDTEVDPHEEHDVAAERPDEVARLGAELRNYILRDPSLVMRGGMAVPREDLSRESAP